MTELSCPVCKINSYLNPDIRIYISPCYHRLCEACLNRTFTHLLTPCFECGTLLRKANFITQVFEDMKVERECKIRKMLAPYIKTSDDFDNIHHYNDYLEDIENEVIELIEISDIEINKIIDKYKQERILTAKKVKLIEEVVEQPVPEDIYDPLSDVDLSIPKLLKKHKIPKCYKVNFLAGGFSENIIVHKAFNALYDDSI